MAMLRRGSAHLALWAAAAAGPGFAQSPPGGHNPAPWRNDGLFQRLDANRDGRISRAEAERDKGFEPFFSKSDENVDGRLSPEEFIKARSLYERSLAAQFLSDSLVTAKVRAALTRSAELDNSAIVVETRDGQVVLTGSVSRDEQRQWAARIAASVSGVTAVNNALAVGAPPSASTLVVNQPVK